jgi:hypothetical protein
MSTQRTSDQREWVIWNGGLGALDTVVIGKIEVGEDGTRRAHLKAPYDMVGPFSLDELETRRFISFAACVVMSRQYWRDEQVELRREARDKRRAAQSGRAARERFWDPGSSPRRGRPPGDLTFAEQRRYRNLLELPTETAVSPAAINSAFRRLAKSAHPDGGGSHDAFVRLTQARDALLAAIS